MNSLERTVLEMVGEDPDSPDVFLDTDEGIAPVRDSINDAIQEIAMLTGGNKRPYLIPLRAEQMFYRFRLTEGYFGWVSDVWDIERKFRLEQADTTRLTNYDPRWMVGTGMPEAYLQIGQGVIGFYKKPAATEGMMEVTICEIPREYETDTEKVKLKDSFQHAVVNYAVAEFWASRGDAREASNHFQMFLNALGLADQYQIANDTRTFSTSKEPWPTVTA